MLYNVDIGCVMCLGLTVAWKELSYLFTHKKKLLQVCACVCVCMGVYVCVGSVGARARARVCEDGYVCAFGYLCVCVWWVCVLSAMYVISPFRSFCNRQWHRLRKLWKEFDILLEYFCVPTIIRKILRSRLYSWAYLGKWVIFLRCCVEVNDFQCGHRAVILI